MKKADWKRLEKVLTNIEIESPIVVNSNEGERLCDTSNVVLV